MERDFTATAPNTKWVADLTRILTGEKVVWLASVRDAFSNKAVGWRCGPRPDTDLVLSVLDYALFSRDVRGGESISPQRQGALMSVGSAHPAARRRGIAPSTGSVGDSFDNVLAENQGPSLHEMFGGGSTLTVELIYWPSKTFATRPQAEAALFRYIEVWYNPRRIQVGRGGLSPDEYEQIYHDRPDQQEADTIVPELTGVR